MDQKHILRNLSNLIHKSSLRYMNEFVWQDVELTEDFRHAYENYLHQANYNIEFHQSTAVITSPLSKYIFVPNQWFVIASYTVDVCEELLIYKEYFKKISGKLGKRPDFYAKQLRDCATIIEKNEFTECANHIFSKLYDDEKMITGASGKLWRFVNDYSWWSGQKTIDRGDFYVSVILNMLNLVNASQGYVADIVNAYASDIVLRQLVKSVDGFTVNLMSNIIEAGVSNDYYTMVDENPQEHINIREAENYGGEESRPKIKISASGLREIKYRK